jgi:redox-sensitive bicupin YhaK (pirin superfamily)
MIDMVIDQRRRDLGGGLAVGRVLPFAKHRMVGPFIFFDHMGPLDLAPGIDGSLDVRPHPHIGLSTVTYLFAGEVMHRDSLGNEMAVRPQEVNWMTAGSGITHSERPAPLPRYPAAIRSERFTWRRALWRWMAGASRPARC